MTETHNGYYACTATQTKTSNFENKLDVQRHTMFTHCTNLSPRSRELAVSNIHGQCIWLVEIAVGRFTCVTSSTSLYFRRQRQKTTLHSTRRVAAGVRTYRTPKHFRNAGAVHNLGAPTHNATRQTNKPPTRSIRLFSPSRISRPFTQS